MIGFSTTFLVKNRCINTSVVFISLSIFYSIGTANNGNIRTETSSGKPRTHRAIKDRLISKWFKEGSSSLAPIVMEETHKYLYSNSHNRKFSINTTEEALRASGHLASSTILCVVLLSATNQSKQMFLSNLNSQQSVDHVCDWAVVCYSGDDALLSSMCYEGKQLGASIVHCERVQSVENMAQSLWNRANTIFSFKDNYLRNGDHGYYPKPMLFFNLIQHLHRYRWLWVMDDDIDIRSINVTRFLSAVESDSLRPPILIAQPLVKGYTSYASLKWSTWLPENSSLTNSTPSYSEMKRAGFVEMVAPLLDCRFFHWFVTVVVPLIARPMYLLEADHGIDRIWCQAAKFFHEQQHHGEVAPSPRSVASTSHGRDKSTERYVFDNSSAVSTSSSVCGLFVSDRDFIRHLNLKSSIAGKPQELVAQHAKNQTTMNEIMKVVFPEWFVHFHY